MSCCLKHCPNSPFSLFKYSTLSFPVSFPLSVPISREAMEAHHLSEVSSLPQLITCPQAMKQPEKQYRHLLWQAGGEKKTFYLHCCLSFLPGRGPKGQEHNNNNNNRKCKVCGEVSANCICPLNCTIRRETEIQLTKISLNPELTFHRQTSDPSLQQLVGAGFGCIATLRGLIWTL